MLDWLFEPNFLKLTEKRDVTRLIALLRDSRWAGRAVSALGEVRDRRAVEPLLACLSDPRLRSDAVLALGKLGDPRAVEPLVGLLDAEPWPAREVVAIALGRLRDRRAVPGLARLMLREREPRVRREAAVALQTIGGPEADGALARDEGQAALNIDFCDECHALLEPIGIPPMIEYLRSRGNVTVADSDEVPAAVREDPFVFRGFLCRKCDRALCPACSGQGQVCPGRSCGSRDLVPAYRPLLRNRRAALVHKAILYDS